MKKFSESDWNTRIKEYLKYMGKDPSIAKITESVHGPDYYELLLFDKNDLKHTYSCYLDSEGKSRSGSIGVEDVIAFTDSKYMTFLRNETFHDYVCLGDFLSMFAVLGKGM